MNKKQEGEINKAINFLEEFIWLFESKRNFKFNEVPNILRELLDDPVNIGPVEKKYVSPNPNIHFLIGVLPRLFKDRSLFPLNSSIIQFANEVLDIDVSSNAKRSRIELIGHIVCETDNLSDSKLEKLVRALTQLTGDEEKLTKVKEAQINNNFSWNETIQKLTE
ncbi:hypothetical protein [Calidifontibacillus oryziterrae]|uniref:hypothetical protein n=1 Tax=Calidifontibacillus oryziterrae TaxID=1191699 RepID=UPI000317963D|nr:hypothetical protein [Calidifontibacillus oryziterrae]